MHYKIPVKMPMLKTLHYFMLIKVIFVTGSEKRYIVAHIFKIELLAPRGRVISQL